MGAVVDGGEGLAGKGWRLGVRRRRGTRKSGEARETARARWRARAHAFAVEGLWAARGARAASCVAFQWVGETRQVSRRALTADKPRARASAVRARGARRRA